MSTELPPLPPMPYVMEKPAVRQYAIDYARAALAARKPLTDEQVAQIMRGLNESLSGPRGWGWIDVARAIERAHGIGEKQ